MLLGYASGKVGSLVFARLKGQQITRAYNPAPNDKKSEAQVAQRVKLPSMVTFYRRNNTFFPYAFETKDQKWSEYNAFVSANLLAGRTVYYDKGKLDEGYPVVAPFMMSRGTLQGIDTAFIIDTETTPNHTVATSIVCDPSVSQKYSHPFSNVDYSTDIAQLSGLLLEQNDYLNNGDMITIYVVATDKINSVGEIDETKLANANIYFKAQFTIDVNATGKLDIGGLYLCSVNVGTGKSPVLGLRDYGEAPVAVKADATSMYSLMANGGMGAVTVLSRNSTSGVKVSYSVLRCNEPATTYYNEYASATAKAQAMSSYTYNPDGFLKPRPNLVTSN